MRRWIAVVSAAVAVGGLLIGLNAGGANASNAPPPQVIVVNATNSPVPVSGNVAAAQSGQWNVNLTGTPTVAVGNFPAAPTTLIVRQGTADLAVGAQFDTGLQDVRADRSVTLYVSFGIFEQPGEFDCFGLTRDAANLPYSLGTFAVQDVSFSHTWDPAPPNIQFFCTNNTSRDSSVHYMLTGRDG